MTDHTTGAFVGRMLPNYGGEFGVISNLNNKLYTDVSFIVQWADDHEYARRAVLSVSECFMPTNVGSTSRAKTQLQT